MNEFLDDVAAELIGMVSRRWVLLFFASVAASSLSAWLAATAISRP